MSRLREWKGQSLSQTSGWFPQKRQSPQYHATIQHYYYTGGRCRKMSERTKRKKLHHQNALRSKPLAPSSVRIWPIQWVNISLMAPRNITDHKNAAHQATRTSANSFSSMVPPLCQLSAIEISLFVMDGGSKMMLQITLDPEIWCYVMCSPNRIFFQKSMYNQKHWWTCLPPPIFVKYYATNKWCSKGAISHFKTVLGT